LLFVGVRFFQNEGPAESTASLDSRTVTLASVADLSAGTSPIPLLGTVTSVNEATIRAESSGKIVRVEKRLGDFVSAGTVIAYFENSGEQAAVLQAQGAYDAAVAAGRIASINRGGANNSLSEAKSQALNTISSAYSTLDDAVRTKTDSVWRDPAGTNQKLNVNPSNAGLVIGLQEKRINIESILRKREARNGTLSVNSDLVSELTEVEDETKIVQGYLDDLSAALNRSLPDANISQAALDGLKTSTAIGRQATNGILPALTGSRNALKAGLSQSQVADQNAGTGDAAAASASDSQIKSALGLLRGAQSRLDQTIIRSPLSGTINSLSINTGDFVSAFTPVAIVSNNGALLVLAYVTENDARELSVGGKVSIGTNGSGVITRIAPAIDPLTKKIEVRIGITSGESSLVNGQSVNISASRSAKKIATNETIKIPLSALKLTPSGPLVFTVGSGNTLVGHPVKEGALLGDQIVIESGITSDMRIVTDARGLQEGMNVKISNI
jgi:RND family efflux transporter MFP subunit